MKMLFYLNSKNLRMIHSKLHKNPTLFENLFFAPIKNFGYHFVYEISKNLKLWGEVFYFLKNKPHNRCNGLIFQICSSIFYSVHRWSLFSKLHAQLIKQIYNHFFRPFLKNFQSFLAFLNLIKPIFWSIW